MGILAARARGDLATLEQLTAEAARAGCVMMELYGRYAIAEAERGARKEKAAVAHLREVERAASERGYGLFARWAAEALRRKP